MAKKLILATILTVSLFWYGAIPFSLAAEKVRVGYLRMVAPQGLIMVAAEEKGFWTQNGLVAEGASFGSGALVVRAMAAGALDLGIGLPVVTIPAVARGLPLVIVASLYGFGDWVFWVREPSRIRQPGDLPGAKIGIHALGGPGHAFARAVIKALGIKEKEVRFVASGGIPQEMAAFRAGVTDVLAATIEMAVTLKAAGKARALLRIGDFLPKDWIHGIVFGPRQFIETSRQTTSGTVRALIQARSFIAENPDWAMEKLTKGYRYNEKEAKLVYDDAVKIVMTNVGRLTPAAVNSVVNFLVEYGIVEKEKLPPIDDLYALEFIR